MQQSRNAGLEHLGYIRLALAISVALFHLLPQVFPDAGRHAVVGFFCISGFLITKIASETYSRRPAAFILNRFLRIYPVYWVCAAIIVAIGMLIPEAQKVLNLGITVPSSASMWLTAVTLFGREDPMLRVIPQTWSLQLEMMFYLILGLLTFRSEIVTYFAFAFAIIAGVASLLGYIPYPIYYSIPGAGFMFYGGASAYFLLRRGVSLPRSALFAASLAYILTMFVLPLIVGVSEHTLIWLHSLLFASAGAMFVILLALPITSTLSVSASRISRFMGRLAYPVFLLHYGVGAMCLAIWGDEIIFAVISTLAITLGCSVLIVRLVEMPIEGLRSRMRSSRRAVQVVPP